MLYEAMAIDCCDLAKWLLAPERGERRLIANQETLDTAALWGRLELVQWLIDPARGDQRLTATQNTLDKAAESGNPELVQWLEQSPERKASSVAALAVAVSSRNSSSPLHAQTAPEANTNQPNPQRENPCS